MKEELFHMLDGDLPDEGVAELLHRLSVDPEKRSLFLQQVRLQHALAHNGGEESMTTIEATEMRDRIASAIGAGGASTPRGRFRPRVLGTLALGLIVGAGLGVVADRLTTPAPPPEVHQQMPAPVNMAPPAAARPAPIDSAIALDTSAARPNATDSLAKASTSTAKSGRKAAVRKSRKQSYGDDLTGAREAREIMKKKRTHRSTPD